MALVLAELPPFVLGLLVVAFIIVSLLLMLAVLVQRPSGGGLSGAFGSAAEGAGQTAFGARTGDALTILTIGAFLLFLGFAVGLNYVIDDTPGGVRQTAVQSDPAAEGAAEGEAEEPTDAEGDGADAGAADPDVGPEGAFGAGGEGEGDETP